MRRWPEMEFLAEIMIFRVLIVGWTGLANVRVEADIPSEITNMTLPNFGSDEFKLDSLANVSVTQEPADDLSLDQKWNKMFSFHDVNITCHLEQLCSNVVANTEESFCFCDNECVMFHDCCADWYLLKFPGLNASEIFNLMEHPVDWYKTTQLGHLDILSDYILTSDCHKLSNGSKTIVVQMVATCPTDYEDTFIINKCVDSSFHPLESIPVSIQIKMDFQIVFKNIYCAMCHGKKESDVVTWNITASCPEDMTFTESSQDLLKAMKDTCDFSLYPPERLGKVRLCFPHRRMNQNCSHVASGVDNSFMTLCQGYRSPVKVTTLDSSVIYANPHCAICDVGNTVIYHCYAQFQNENAGSLLPNFGLNILFNFNSHTGSWYSTNVEICEESKVKHPAKTSCSTLICPLGSRASYGFCVDDEFAVFNHTQNLPLGSDGLRQYNISIFIYITSEEANSLSPNVNITHLLTVLDQSQIQNLSNLQLVNSSVQQGQHGPRYHQIYRYVVKTPESHTFKKLIQNVHNKIFSSVNELTIDSVRFTNIWNNERYNCGNAKMINYTREYFMVLPGTDFYVKPNGSEISINVEKTVFDFTVYNGTSDPTFSMIAFCKETVSLNCSLLSYNEGEYQIVDSSVYIIARDAYVADFEIRNDVLYVCQNISTYEEIPSDNTMDILNTVMLSISITSLLVLLVIHCAVSSLRTSHGKNLMAFSTCLLIAQSLFITGSRVIGDICVVVAISQHYFWLCTFMWTSTMAYDLAKKLNAWTMMKTASMNVSNSFRIFCVVSNGLPFLLVTSCVIIDNINLTDLTINYGLIGQYCWIGNTIANLCVFGCPVFLCLLFNIVCFGISLHGIQGTKQATKSVRSKTQNRNYCIIYTKISILLGGTWLIGFIAPTSKVEFLTYVSVCLNGLQGLFVLLGFILNARVIRSLGKKSETRSSALIASSSEMTSISAKCAVKTHDQM